MVAVENAHPTLRLDPDRLAATLVAAVAGEGRSLGDVTVVLADHATVRDLNRSWLDHDYDTDVLSFWLGADDGSGPVDGEVYVDLDTARERHAEFGAGFDAEATRYALHGVLHLLGYDDATPEQKAAMHVMEDRYLSTP